MAVAASALTSPLPKYMPLTTLHGAARRIVCKLKSDHTLPQLATSRWHLLALSTNTQVASKAMGSVSSQSCHPPQSYFLVSCHLLSLVQERSRDSFRQLKITENIKELIDKYNPLISTILEI